MPKPKTSTRRRETAKAAARRTTQARAKQPRLTDPEIDITPVRIVDDRRFSGKYQVIEDEGERRVLGWGFASAAAARGWVEVQNKLSAWLRLNIRSDN
jgi:hypothetical protein